MNVLIVDNEEISNAIGKTVVQLGHEAVVTENYQEALKKISESTFDLILWDINLSNGTGINLLSEIRESNRDLNIVTMTMFSNREMEERVREQGIIYYMIKPFKLDELRSIINHLAKRETRLCS